MEQQSALDSVYTWIKTHPAMVDACLAAAVAFILAGGYLVAVFDLYGTLVSLGLTLPLLLRRSHPVVSAGVIALAGVVQLLTIRSLVPADGAVMLSLYALAAYGPVWASRAGLIAGLTGAGASVVRYVVSPLYNPGYSLIVAGFAGTLVLASWLLGHLRRLSVHNEYRLAERARLLEIDRDQQAQLAATAERARIARELHDVVAHSLSVTVAQADGGRYAAKADPEAAVKALETIASTSRQALTDMRALLGVLRAGDQAAFAPQPGIFAIPALVEQVASSGLDVRFRVEGEGHPLPPGPELAAYRIVQESLTNVLKHGGPGAHALVELSWSKMGLTVTVTDDGRGAAAVGPADSPAGTGQGVPGMRERATMHGGSLSAGPRPGGGYAVRAVIPYVRPV